MHFYSKLPKKQFFSQFCRSRWCSAEAAGKIALVRLIFCISTEKKFRPHTHRVAPKHIKNQQRNAKKTPLATSAIVNYTAQNLFFLTSEQNLFVSEHKYQTLCTYQKEKSSFSVHGRYGKRAFCMITHQYDARSRCAELVQILNKNKNLFCL